MTERSCPAYVLAHVAPDFFSSLSDVERFVLPWVSALWLRPEQMIPDHDWRSCGYIAGRRWGKTHGVASWINAKVEAGAIKKIGLMAPNETRVDEVQIQSLIETAPPWFKPRRERGTIVWPNGVEAEIFTPEAPGRPRGSTLDFSWLCELVDWAPTTRVEAFNNITTATSSGLARYVYDTTSKGRNDIILMQEELNRAHPREHVIVRGTMFDNPYLSAKYLRDECRKYKGRRYAEEIEGKVFSGAAGAAWDQAIIDRNRRAARPEAPSLVLVSVDPALSGRLDADEVGIAVGDRARDGDVFVHTDLSGHHGPFEWARIVVDWCEREAAGVVIERNAGGDLASANIMSEARTRGLTYEALDKGRPFPPRRPGHIYIREVVSRKSKGARAAGPAAETDAGRVHHVGHLDELEYQMTTYVDEGGGESPNRLDAAVFLITELAGLEHEKTGDAKQDVAAAAKAQETLMAALRKSAAGRRIGL